LRNGFRQGLEAATLPAGQYHCQALCLSHRIIPPERNTNSNFPKQGFINKGISTRFAFFLPKISEKILFERGISLKYQCLIFRFIRVKLSRKYLQDDN
ncbi:MAG: hypothetical protein IJL14_02860, partial [Selenomonadaceae bacterium]|nr:hypothetical protein [Selenomonadaceae bacterium]